MICQEASEFEQHIPSLNVSKEALTWLKLIHRNFNLTLSTTTTTTPGVSHYLSENIRPRQAEKGAKKFADNYRPVSLTYIICKLLEKIIRESMVNHLKKYDLFSDKQYGFISGRSTVLQLLEVLESWTQSLDVGNDIDVAYCDYMKAFDKVSHQRFIHKLKMYRFGEVFQNWIGDFLAGRKQKVIVNGTVESQTGKL